MPVPPAGDLRRLTGYWLRRAYEAANSAAEAFVGDDVRPRELGALYALAEHGAMSQRRLGELTQISPTLAGRLVDQLVEKGWVTRERSATDRRTQLVSLTPSGRRALKARGRKIEEAEQQLVSVLSPAEATRLTELLRSLLAGSPVLESSELADHVGYLVAHAHRQLREEATRRMAELRLHPRDFGLLTALAQDAPCSQAHLANRLQVTPPAVLALLDNLAAQDLVQRERSASDRRMQEVRLTDHGRATLRRAQQLASGIQGEIQARLGERGDVELRDLLARVARQPAA